MDENRNLTEGQPEQEQVEALEQTVAEAAETGAEEAMAGLRAQLEAALEEKLLRLLEENARLFAMSPEERAEYEAGRRESDIDRRERDVTRRELRADALEELAKRGLPKALADAIGYESRDGMLASVEAVERAFREAVQAAVEERLRGTSPAAGASAQGDAGELDDETYYRMNSMGH